MVDNKSVEITPTQSHLLKIFHNKSQIKTHPLAKCPRGILQEIFFVFGVTLRSTPPLQSKKVKKSE